MGILFVLAVVYGLLVAAAFLFQRRLLYVPETQKPSESEVQALGLDLWPSGDAYRGFVGAPADRVKGTVVFFHGNAAAAWRRDYYPQVLLPLSYRVILAEYPGYGGRAGRPSERSLLADARATVGQAHREFGGPIYLWGESLGAGVAAAVAADPTVPVAGVVLLTPWDTLPDLAQSLYWYLPARWLILDRYDNIGNLGSFEGRVAVVMAGRDEVIPQRHAQRLYRAFPEPKRLWVLDGVGHNDWPAGPNEPWWGEVMTFVAGDP